MFFWFHLGIKFGASHTQLFLTNCPSMNVWFSFSLMIFIYLDFALKLSCYSPEWHKLL